MRKDKLKLLVDGQSVDRELFETIDASTLLENGLIKSTGDGAFTSSFVGLFYTPKMIVFSLPYGVSSDALDEMSDERLRNFLINVIKSITQFESHYSGYKEITLSGRMEAALNLLEEYEEFGFLKLYEKKNSKQASGKTNWNRTIKTYIPLKQGDTWIYDSYIRRKNVSHHGHDFVELQKWALRHALELTYFITDDFDITSELLNTDLNIVEARELFLRLRNNSTKDREIYLLELIGTLLDEETNLLGYSIYTKHFKVIWEKALQNTLLHDSSLVNLIPRVSWKDDEIVLNSLSLDILGTTGRPEVDIIFEEEDKLYILDAKYYDLRTRRPGLKDLYKQLFYGVAFQYLLNLENLPENGFIFPILSPEKQKTFSKFSLVQYKLQELNKDLANIPAYFADINMVLKSFVEHKELRTEYLKIK